MNALYEEFLNHHGLNNGLIYRVLLPHERIFKDVPKLSYVRFGNHKVFVNESVNNAVAFSKQIHLAQMNADQALLPFFKLIDAIPGLSHKKHMEIVDACRYMYYDAIGDVSLRDVFDEKNPMPTFDYDWNKK